MRFPRFGWIVPVESPDPTEFRFRVRKWHPGLWLAVAWGVLTQVEFHVRWPWSA